MLSYLSMSLYKIRLEKSSFKKNLSEMLSFEHMNLVAENFIIIIHVIFSWTQIGRFGVSDREIGSQIGRFFRGIIYSILVSKIVICSTVDHCKMFYLPAYC